jgi:hypothetical protein
MAPKSKHCAGVIEQDDLAFNLDNTTTEEIQCDLYSEFSDHETNTEADSNNDDTDWENYEEDLTIDRKGKSKNMFKDKIYEIALANAPADLKEAFEFKGPFKVKQKDIPPEINTDEVDFNHTQCKNETGDTYIGQFRKGTTLREGRGILLSSENYIYEGFWIDDQKFGVGRIIIENGNTYQGEWANDVS